MTEEERRVVKKTPGEGQNNRSKSSQNGEVRRKVRAEGPGEGVRKTRPEGNVQGNRPKSSQDGEVRRKVRAEGSGEGVRKTRPEGNVQGNRPKSSQDGEVRRKVRAEGSGEGVRKTRPEGNVQGNRPKSSQDGEVRRKVRPEGSGEGVRRPRPEGSDEVVRKPRPEGSGESVRKKRPDATNKAAGRPVRDGKKKLGVGKIILFAVEIVVLIVMIFILWTVLKTEKVGKMELKEEDIIINEEVKYRMETTSENTENGEGNEASTGLGSAFSGYRNIALFGVDSREGALTKNTRSDTIIIASINGSTGDVKLVSVYRDTYLNLSNDSYNKCNAAYAKGGPTQAINMLNMNLDLDISDFITIGFEGLIDVIDALGGVEVNVLDSEIVHLNNYQISMVGTSKDGTNFTATAGTDYTPVTSSGLQTLNGLQATAYCRIRYVGNDFMRAERQRAVIQAIVEKAKKNPTKLAGIAEGLFDEVYTSLDLSEIIELLGNIANYQIVDEGGFPEESMRGGANVGKKGSCVIPVDLTSNVIWLHQFLFNDMEYDPSATVKKCSVHIYEDVSPYM